MSFISRLFGGGESQQETPAPAPAPAYTPPPAPQIVVSSPEVKMEEPKGPTAAERAIQEDQARLASRANAEQDGRAALVSRVAGLRKALAFRDRVA